MESNDTFGYGQVTESETVTPGEYYLSWAASGNNTGSGSEGRGVDLQDRKLERPHPPVTFQSWALVYE